MHARVFELRVSLPMFYLHACLPQEPWIDWPSCGAGYTANDFQVAAVLTDKGETVKITGAHTIDATQALAGEVSKAVHKDEATLVTFGYASHSPAPLCSGERGTQQEVLLHGRLDERQ